MNDSLFHNLHQLATERWVRQAVRTVLRGCWLAACVWCIGLGGHLLWAWPLRLNVLAVLSLGILGASLLLILRSPMPPREVARRLDRRFHLDEQLATAVELPRERRDDAIAARLLAESARTATHVRRRLGRQRAAPWSEVLALLAMLLVLSGLSVLLGIGRFDLGAIGAVLPPLPVIAPPAEQQAQDPFTPQQGGPQAPGTGGGDESGQGADPQVIGPIADALRDQGATRPAAEALDRGDVPAAAQSLRELADQAGQLSEQARRDLASNLREAADQIEERNAGLADQLRESADGLQQGGQQAGQALEDLARALEQANGQDAGEQGQGQDGQQGQGEQGNQPGDQGQQQGQGQGEQGQGQGQGGGAGGTGNSPAGEGRQKNPSDRLGVEGQPIELDAEGDSTDTPGTGEKPPTTAEVVPGRVSGGSGGGEQGTTGADPLRVPVEERDVVQDYFTP